jgi:XRE family transcriptional regulator, regulator of sulfur utilization
MNNTESVAQHFSRNLEYFRKSKSMTQQDLALKSGIPRSTITNLESGGGNPSLNNLVKLAQSLEVQVEELITPPLQESTLIKANDSTARTKNGCSLFNLLPHFVKGLQIERFEIPPNKGFTGVPHKKGTKEYFICLQGKAEVLVMGTAYELSKNDILYFKGDVKHSYRSISNTKCIGLSILTQMGQSNY